MQRNQCQTEPRKATHCQAGTQQSHPDFTDVYYPRRLLRKRAARVMGNQWLNWLHLKGHNNLTEGTNKNEPEVPDKGRKPG